MRFHPVRLVGGEGAPIEVELLNGRRVRVREGFSSEELRRVLEGGRRRVMLPSSVKIYVASEPTDLRDGLAAATRSVIGQSPLSGHPCS